MDDLRDHRTGGIGWRERPGQGSTPAATLVCLHGIGSDAASFDALARALPTGPRMIAWNAPGYGNSPPLPRDWPVADDYAAALDRLVAALGLERFVLLGHSLGTLIAAAYALREPGRISDLVLVSCAQGMGMAPGGTLPAAAADRLRDLQVQGAQDFARLRAPRLIHEPGRNPALVAAVEAAMARVSQPGYGQAVRMLASGDLSAMAGELRVPVSIVVGARDRVTPPAQSESVWSALPAAVRRRFDIVPDCGHALPQQAPAALAAILAGAIARNEGEDL